MYKMGETTGREQVIEEATQRPPFGPGLGLDALAGAVRMETWGTSFEDSGEFVEFRCFDAEGNHVVTGCVSGY